jgi:DNA-binding XRE family transcriptional regulator
MNKKTKRIPPTKTHAELVKGWRNEPRFKAEYDALEEEYQLLREMLMARKRAGLTQEEVAEKMGTKAPAIARLESTHHRYQHSPTLNTLREYATAVGCTLEVHFKRASRKISRSK